MLGSLIDFFYSLNPALSDKIDRFLFSRKIRAGQKVVCIHGEKTSDLRYDLTVLCKVYTVRRVAGKHLLLRGVLGFYKRKYFLRVRDTP